MKTIILIKSNSFDSTEIEIDLERLEKGDLTKVQDSKGWEWKVMTK